MNTDRSNSIYCSFPGCSESCPVGKMWIYRRGKVLRISYRYIWSYTAPVITVTSNSRTSLSSVRPLSCFLCAIVTTGIRTQGIVGSKRERKAPIFAFLQPPPPLPQPARRFYRPIAANLRK